MANSAYVTKLASRLTQINKDDRNLLEFQAARSGGSNYKSPLPIILEDTINKGMMVEGLDASISSVLFDYSMAFTAKSLGRNPSAWEDASWFDSEAATRRAKLCRQLVETVRRKPNLIFEALNPQEESIWARALARAGNKKCLEVCENFKDRMPLDYRITRIEYFWVSNNTVLEDLEIVELLKALRNTTWQLPNFLDIEVCLKMINERLIKSKDRLKGRETEMLALIAKPFDTELMNNERLLLRYSLASRLENKALLPIMLEMEPHFPLGNRKILAKRLEVYRELKHPNLPQAEQDWDFFTKWN